MLELRKILKIEKEKRGVFNLNKLSDEIFSTKDYSMPIEENENLREIVLKPNSINKILIIGFHFAIFLFFIINFFLENEFSENKFFNIIFCTTILIIEVV